LRSIRDEFRMARVMKLEGAPVTEVAMNPAAPTPQLAFAALTAELADEARRHLAFSCYCTACEAVAQKPWPRPAAGEGKSGK
jgi:hypothetical protein